MIVVAMHPRAHFRHHQRNHYHFHFCSGDTPIAAVADPAHTSTQVGEDNELNEVEVRETEITRTMCSGNFSFFLKKLAKVSESFGCLRRLIAAAVRDRGAAAEKGVSKGMFLFMYNPA